MQRPNQMRWRWVLAILFLIPSGLAGQDSAGTPDESRRPAVVFLVRHAEKEGGGRDPQLSAAGAARAQALANLLRDAGVEQVHTTNFLRTRQTAEPVASLLGVEPQLYDPRDLAGLAERLQSVGGRHLVVGHSNTTPDLVKRLGGDPGPHLEEATEFDRLYIVTLSEQGRVETVRLHYGDGGEK